MDLRKESVDALPRGLQLVSKTFNNSKSEGAGSGLVLVVPSHGFLTRSHEELKVPVSGTRACEVWAPASNTSQINSFDPLDSKVARAVPITRHTASESLTPSLNQVYASERAPGGRPGTLNC